MLRHVLKRLFSPTVPHRKVDFSTAYGLYQEGRLDDAEIACQAVRDAARADIDFLLGLIAEKRGDLERAVEAMTAAANGREEEPSFHYSLANVLSGLGRHAKAIEHFKHFLAHTNNDDVRRVPACITAGQCAMSLHDDESAMWWFAQAVSSEPRQASLLVADALFQESRVEQARAVLAPQADSGDYAARLRLTLLLPAIYHSCAEIDATRERLSRELDELLAQPAKKIDQPVSDIGVIPFYLAYHNKNNVEMLQKVCRVMRRAYTAPAAEMDLIRKRGTRTRIGFISNFFFSHSVGRTTIGLIRDLPRDRFSVFVFAVDPQDDAMRASIEAASDHYRALPAVLEDVRLAINEAELDVLVFADIGMHPLTYFLALWRLAPLQIATWGHSETSGIDTIDYYLSADEVEIVEAQSFYSERLLRPKTFFLPGYSRPDLQQHASRRELGLAEGRHLYACLQPLFKVHPDMDLVFAAILERDPQAEILLLESKPSWTEQIRERFARTLGENAPRLRFLPRMPHQSYLATLAVANVALDPLYFGGCNSSCEAMALGLPLITLPGNHLYGRFTHGLYREMRIDDCIADSTIDYVNKAVLIASDWEVRSTVSKHLLARNAVLFERKDLTLEFARFIENEALARV